VDKRLASEKRIGRAVREHRVASKWSQEELSFEAGLHRTYIGCIERGEKNITLRNLIKVAAALGVKASDILLTAEL
jgi:transcriptional regulator with XRE-family HTH domain